MSITRQIRGRCCGSNRGFTLIELLIVIAIIALLLAIMLPCLRMAKVVSKRTYCQNNLRQLAQAWNMYLGDYDGYFFQGVYADVNYGGWKGLAQYSPRPLNSFVDLNDTLDDEKPAKVFCCPADTGGASLTLPREVSYRYWGTSYRTNIFMIGQNKYSIFNPGRTDELDKKISNRIEHLNISHITADPALLMLIGDQGWLNQWRWMPPPIKAEWQREQKPYTEWHIRPEHYNMAFLDGHVAFVRIRKAYYITDDYSILPFKDLFYLAYRVQGE